jgi:hypothetical protein
LDLVLSDFEHLNYLHKKSEEIKLYTLSGVKSIIISVLNFLYFQWTRNIVSDIKICHLNNVYVLVLNVPFPVIVLRFFEQF